MNQPDELDRLWQTQPLQTEVKGEEMRQIITQRMARFDRTIRQRNMREVVGAFVGAIGFSYMAVRQTYWVSRLGSAMIMATFVWIIYYFWRHGSGPEDLNPDQNAAAYQRALISKIDHQIRLVRSAKLWFLLPLYVGLLLLTAGDVIAHAAAGLATWRDAIGPLFYTLVFAVIWWANDVYAAGKLQHWRTKLESGLADDCQC